MRYALCPMLFLWAGVDRSVAVGHDGHAAGAFLGGGVHGFEKDLESDFFVLFDGFGQTGFICCEPFLPSFFFEFFFSAHNKTPSWRLKV